MKKIISLILASISILICFSSCTKRENNVPDGFAPAENDGTDYFFVYPAEWTLERNDAGMTSVYVSEVDFSNVSVTVFTWNNEYQSLSQYVEKYYFKQFKDNFSNLEYPENEDGTPRLKNAKIDSRDAVIFEYSAMFGEEKYMFKTCIISENGYIYTLTYTAKEDKYESHIEAVDMIFDNFQFKK